MSAPLLPRDVPTSETVQFLQRFPLGEAPRVLEIGCGAGDLALRLGALGWHVLGIDRDPAIVDTARRRGVDAVTADLLAFESDPFDAVVVSRSLHHLPSLDAALDRVLALLRPGGWLLMEEFAFESCDRNTAAWMFERRDLLEESGTLRSEGPRLQMVDPLERWTAAHADPLPQPGAAMREGVEARLKLLFNERAPYLYRYLCAELEPSRRGHRLAQLTLEQERRAIDESLIRPIGLRMAARNED